MANLLDEVELLEIDRQDALRFRRLVQAGLENDTWFLRMARRIHDQPKSLEEVRHIMDYVLRAEAPTREAHTDLQHTS